MTTRLIRSVVAFPSILFFLAVAVSCGNETNQKSRFKVFIDEPTQFPSFNRLLSPYRLPPESSIAVCRTSGVATRVEEDVISATREWLAEAGRQALRVHKNCDPGSAGHLIKLVPVSNDVNYYGMTRPVDGHTQIILVAPRWAIGWTGTHELGHVFGFGHPRSVISVMNTNDTPSGGQYMNGGKISAYDRMYIKKLLKEPEFDDVNRLWERSKDF